MKFNIITYGCKVNTYESTLIKEQLEENNFIYIDDYKNSDIVIVNTCSVTNTSDNKCKKMIRDVRRDNKDCVLVVCGCAAENHREELNNLDIDILIGNTGKNNLVKYINEFLNKKQKSSYFCDTKNRTFEKMAVHNFSLTRAFVKIQDGCNNYCSYCIIPYLRGNIRSKDINDAYEEINKLVKNGHKEIVLTGINTGAYGKETGKYNLVTLIRKISTIKKLERIRVSSIEITEIDDEFIEELKTNSKLCGHLHVSLQSGCDKTLKMMNRKYTKEEYLSKVKKIRISRPNINLTTDVIVGFPGENEEDFQESLSFCQEVGFSKIHVFPFSPRTKTKAASMPNQVDNKVKKERVHKLIDITKKLEESYYNKFKNQEVNVLIEEVNNNQSIGHTENFIKVVINDKLIPNENYKCLITKIYPEYVEGTTKIMK